MTLGIWYVFVNSSLFELYLLFLYFGIVAFCYRYIFVIGYLFTNLFFNDFRRSS